MNKLKNHDKKIKLIKPKKLKIKLRYYKLKSG